MKKLTRQVGRFLREEDGATAIEYGLIASLISCVIIVAVTAAGASVEAVFTAVKTALDAGL